MIAISFIMMNSDNFNLFIFIFLALSSNYTSIQYNKDKMKARPSTRQNNNIPSTNVPSINVRCPQTIKQPSLSKKTKPTPIKSKCSSQQDLSSTNNQQFLLLQIKQLRRENNFLKKKVRQLTQQFGPDKPKAKIAKSKIKGVQTPTIDILPLSVNIFFDEIHNLLNTVVKLFSINFTQEQVAMYQAKQQIEEVCPIKKHVLLKKFYLKKKLDSILMQQESSQFALLLELFTEYYQSKEESQKKIIETVDRMTIKAHGLNQWIIQKAQEKKKSKGTYSTIKPQDDLPTSTLKPPTSPRNFVANSKPSTYSPSAKRNIRGQQIGLSPA